MASKSAVDYRRYLDPQVLARISGLDLRARMVVEGYFAGSHRSPSRGLSIEFADHRVYAQGDDIRHIDWKVYGRTNKFYVKQYEQETNLNVILAVDGSGSMAYRGSEAQMSKHEYATALAASLAYLALQQRDSVGVVQFDKTVTKVIKPSNHPQQWKTLVQELAGHGTTDQTRLGSVLDELAERVPRRSLVVLISDLFDRTDDLLRGLRHLKFRHHDVVVLQVLDHDEVTFPFRRPTLFDGLERQFRCLTDPRRVRKQYITALSAFTDAVRVGCRKMTIDFAQFDTTDRLDGAISTYLATRSSRLRTRGARTGARRA